MIKHILFLLLSILIVSVKSQNLVPNPSFEEFEECPDDVTLFSKYELIPQWYMPNRGTSDYFNSCTIRQVNVPNNVMGSMFALDGEAYAGIILTDNIVSDSSKKSKNYREYLQTKLTEPLKKDKLYCVKFYYSIASYSYYAVNKIGACVSVSKIGNRLNTKVLKVDPQIQADPSKIIIERDYWNMVCDTLRAQGNEKYITIGNFYDDRNTEIENLDYLIYRKSIREIIKENKIAYYYIDVVSVTEVSDTTLNFCEDKYIRK